MAEKNEAKPKKRRGPGRPIKKGQVLNPGGRPKIPEDIKQAYREHTWDAIATLVWAARQRSVSAAASAVRAAGEILDRGWGKAPQTVTLQGDTGLTLILERKQEPKAADGTPASSETV